jgi:hypothetical protein
VSLLENHVDILDALLTQFAEVDDPYVAERLHVVAHGCALRTDQIPELSTLAQDIYDAVYFA